MAAMSRGRASVAPGAGRLAMVDVVRGASILVFLLCHFQNTRLTTGGGFVGSLLSRAGANGIYRVAAVQTFVGAVLILPGKLSHGIYVLHPLAIWLAWRVLSALPSDAALPAFLAGVVVLVWGSYTFFENPLKRRIA